MALPNPALPYGVRDIQLRAIDSAGVVSSTLVDLPVAQKLSFEEAEDYTDLRGDDNIAATHGNGPSVNWELDEGGISFAALKVINGGTITATGTTPNLKEVYSKKGTDARPYFQIEGQAITDSGGDIHCLIYKCKSKGGVKGEFADAAFFVTTATGVGIPDASENLYDFIHNETAVAIS
jgi:hypothetical protein